MEKKSTKLSNDDMWKLVALEYEYSDEGISDEYWDKNFTRDIIRKDVKWLISKIKELGQEKDSLPNFCANCTCGKSGGCDSI
jgi:hypothetical protein